MRKMIVRNWTHIRTKYADEFQLGNRQNTKNTSVNYFIQLEKKTPDVTEETELFFFFFLLLFLFVFVFSFFF